MSETTEAAKHTPGPWSIVGMRGNETHHPDITVESEWGTVAKVASENCDDDEQVMADARLIAAAPELLEACKFAEYIFNHYAPESGLQRDALQCLRAAIARATGGQS